MWGFDVDGIDASEDRGEGSGIRSFVYVWSVGHRLSNATPFFFLLYFRFSLLFPFPLFPSSMYSSFFWRGGAGMA